MVKAVRVRHALFVLPYTMHIKLRKGVKKLMAKSTLMKGTVKWFDVRKGYGFISDEDGVDCFVHFSSINMDGFKRLRAGQIVSFVQDEDEQGRTVAREVTIITEGEED